MPAERTFQMSITYHGEHEASIILRVAFTAEDDRFYKDRRATTMVFSLPPITSEEVANLRRSARYEHLLLYEDPKGYWCWYLHEDQRYLGRAYAWLRRHEDMHQMHNVYMYEHGAFQRGLELYERILTRLWGVTMLNVEFDGNQFTKHRGHAHLHVFPRYSEPPAFDGRIYADEHFGAHRREASPLKLSTTELEKIRRCLQEEFEKGW